MSSFSVLKRRKTRRRLGEERGFSSFPPSSSLFREERGGEKRRETERETERVWSCVLCARAMGLKKEELERLMLASADKKRKGSWLQSFEASLDSILNEPEKEDREQAEAPPLEERLGPATVCIDLDACNGDVNLDEDRLSMESLSNFCSARTNVCVVSGAWQYEVILGTAGVQQVGWATPTCPFTNEEGVGDFPDSYAYDGKRVRKWNVSCHPYGQPWMTGDVIGCCFNVDEGEISF